MYFQGSSAYKTLDALLVAMAAENGSFLYRKSARYAGYAEFAEAGIAQGLPFTR
jgi:hypothetical protein